MKFFKNFFYKKEKFNEKRRKFLDSFFEKYLEDNIYKFDCPYCEENLGSYSYNFLNKYKKIYCQNCKEEIWVNINFDKEILIKQMEEVNFLWDVDLDKLDIENEELYNILKSNFKNLKKYKFIKKDKET